MIVGYLRKGKCYRAPCRWYPGGPVGTIEYYEAAPNARWYRGQQDFFPWGLFVGEENESDVGELTQLDQRSYWSGKLPNPPAGLFYVGSESDFKLETPYPGPLVSPISCAKPKVNDENGFAISDGESVPVIPEYVDGFRIGDLQLTVTDSHSALDGFKIGDGDTLREIPAYVDGFKIGETTDSPLTKKDGDGFKIGDGRHPFIEGTSSDGFAIGDGDAISSTLVRYFDGFKIGDLLADASFEPGDCFGIGDGDDIVGDPPIIPPGDGDLLGGSFLGNVTVDRTAYGDTMETWTDCLFVWSPANQAYWCAPLPGEIALTAAIGFRSGYWRIACRIDGGIASDNPTMTIFEGPTGTASGEANVLGYSGGGLGIVTITIFPA